MQKLPPLSVFSSYSRRDEKLRAKVVTGFAGLERDGWIEKPWYDQKIVAGQEWDPEILGRLRRSDLVLLLVTDNFINSDYCMKEVDIAMEGYRKGNTRIIPVILQTSDWKIARLASLQALPLNGEPIFRGSYFDRKRLLEVSEGIRTAVQQVCLNGNSQGGRAALMPDANQTVLAQLCNRIEQEEQLRQAWQEHFSSFQLRRRPFICLVHGSVQQDLPGYLKRLTTYSLPQALGLGPDSEIRSALKVRWPEYSAEQSLNGTVMLGALAQGLNCRPQMVDCSTSLYRLGQACVVYYELPSSARNYSDRAALSSFFDFWAEWPDLPVQQRLIVVLSVQYRPGFPVGFPKQEDDLVVGAGKSQRVSAVILKELPPISRQHVKDWIRRQEIEKFCDVENNLAAWESDIDETFGDRNEIPMEQLAATLNRMLTDYQRRAL